MASKSKSSLDSLMMSYTDLSAPSRASTFKGPALKDVKVNKQVAPSFKPSDKSRDWSTLAQNLENAFGHNGQSSSDQSQVQPVISSIPPPPIKTFPCDLDDWGDFQTTSSAEFLVLQGPPSQSVPLGVISSGVSHSQKPKTCVNPNMMIAFTSAPALRVEAAATVTTVEAMSQIDEFSDFISASSIPSIDESVCIQAQASTNVEREDEKPPLTVLNASDANSDTPMYASSKSIFNTEVRDNFADFANFQSAVLPPPPSSEKSISDAAVTNMTNGLESATVEGHPVTSLSLHQTPIPQSGPTHGKDRYSNLRNLFEAEESSSASKLSDVFFPLSNCAASSAPQSSRLNVQSSQEEDDDFGDFVTPSPTAPRIEPSATMPPIKKAFEVTFPESCRTDLLSSQSLTEISITPAVSQQQHEQSFLSESAKLSPVCISHSTIPDVLVNSVFMPQPAATSPAFAPWISDCPPPDDLIDDEQVPSGGVSELAGEIGDDPLGLSLDGEEIEQVEDENISQIVGNCTLSFQPQFSRKTQPETGGKIVSEKPFSGDGDLVQHLDTLSVHNERKGSINSLHLSEDISSANAEATPIPSTEGGKDKYSSLYELSSTHQSVEGLYEGWMKALSQIHRLLYEAWQLLEAIRSDETLQKEVLESRSSISYLANLKELHRIYWRISRSYDTLVMPRLELASKCSDIERSWSLLASSFRSHLERSSDYSQKEEEAGPNYSSALCSVCLASLDLEDVGMNNAVLTLDQASDDGGSRYHAACANFWANCVESNIPDLSCWLSKK